jgi:hypothetical protein
MIAEFRILALYTGMSLKGAAVTLAPFNVHTPQPAHYPLEGVDEV